MAKRALISVLMPCYNSEPYLTEAIQSIINQSYDNWELLICNDSSTDNSLKIIKKLKSSKIQIFENKINQGYLKTCNFLFKQANGDYITFQDSDDYSGLDRLDLLLKEFQKKPQLGACGTQFNFITNEGTKLPLSSPKHPLNKEDILYSFNDSPGICGASVMVKKEVINQIGLYNEYWDRIGAEDHYWMYLISEKFEISNIKNISYFYRHNPNSVTRNKTNPRKIHCHDFLKYFINQRLETGTDFIEEKNFNAIGHMEAIYTKPYTEDPTYIYRKLLDWSYTERDNKAVFKHIINALKETPLDFYWYKTLIYYAKKIYL